MLVTKAMQLAVLVAATVVWDARTDAATSAFKVCGRKLGEIMARVCHVYNSPSWDVPTVVEQPTGLVRRRRQTSGGIADECCTYGCTWEQLSEYCSVSAKTETLLEDTHLIADRSAEQEGTVVSPAVVASEGQHAGTGSSTGTSTGTDAGVMTGTEGDVRREDAVRSAARAAPVVGTVSPLLTWARTLNTDLPQVDRDRYAYVAVYST